MAERCDLAIVGAGYAAINALNAASKYMQPGQTVVVVDRGHRWGGQWPHQYNFVRLHQGFRSYTAGERKWSIDRPDSHLATKDEILMHFDEIVAKVVAETGIKLVELFGYQYDNDYRAEAPGVVRFTARALVPGAADVEVWAGRMINGRGFDVHPKRPLSFGPGVDRRFRSVVPPDLASAEVQAAMRYPRGPPGLIVIVGSGKTAMDCMIKLASLGDEVTRRMRCITGRGTYFMDREVIAGPDGGKHILTLLELFDGDNGEEVLREMAARGFLHSAVPDPAAFQAGVCSRWEVELVRDTVLSPAAKRVVKAHLIDVTADPGGGGVVLHLRPVRRPGAGDTGPAGPGQGATMTLPPNSFVVNCTDQIGEHANLFDPIVSDDGLVLSPQAALGFSGPSAHALTHAWFLGTLGDTWRKLVRVAGEKEYKANNGIAAFFKLVFDVTIVCALLPPELVAESEGLMIGSRRATATATADAPGGASLAAKRSQQILKRAYAKMLRVFPGRYDDKEQYTLKPKSVLMGKIGSQQGVLARL